MSDNNNGGSFLEGLFIGVLLGGIFGVLFAPQAGEKSRAWIKKVSDDNKDILDSAINNSENVISSAKQAISEGFDKISTMIDNKIPTTKKTIRKSAGEA